MYVQWVWCALCALYNARHEANVTTMCLGLYNCSSVSISLETASLFCLNDLAFSQIFCKITAIAKMFLKLFLRFLCIFFHSKLFPTNIQNLVKAF